MRSDIYSTLDAYCNSHQPSVLLAYKHRSVRGIRSTGVLFVKHVGVNNKLAEVVRHRPRFLTINQELLLSFLDVDIVY